MIKSLQKRKLTTTSPKYTTITHVLASIPSPVLVSSPPSTSISGATNSPKRATGYEIFFSIAHICTAEWFFFWVYRFIKHSTYDPNVQEQFTSLLKKRVQERVGMPGDALALAMRLMVCGLVGVWNYQDM
ncbi:putative had-like protein [Botrytis fragariae]|uniref:Putative had-like protein n=1 Tax=Botrytis fragariae TaxID=1964551 RepID=A0A8H6B1B3_9HELO|nr:putative had-like protein [Botrytis fragariae]KAF5877586.1 putative had-like protein [Botrytis fragariae]